MQPQKCGFEQREDLYTFGFETEIKYPSMTQEIEQALRELEEYHEKKLISHSVRGRVHRHQGRVPPCTEVRTPAYAGSDDAACALVEALGFRASVNGLNKDNQHEN